MVVKSTLLANGQLSFLLEKNGAAGKGGERKRTVHFLRTLLLPHLSNIFFQKINFRDKINHNHKTLYKKNLNL